MAAHDLSIFVVWINEPPDSTTAEEEFSFCSWPEKAPTGDIFPESHRLLRLGLELTFSGGPNESLVATTGKKYFLFLQVA